MSIEVEVNKYLVILKESNAVNLPPGYVYRQYKTGPFCVKDKNRNICTMSNFREGYHFRYATPTEADKAKNYVPPIPSLMLMYKDYTIDLRQASDNDVNKVTDFLRNKGIYSSFDCGGRSDDTNYIDVNINLEFKYVAQKIGPTYTAKYFLNTLVDPFNKEVRTIKKNRNSILENVDLINDDYCVLVPIGSYRIYADSAKKLNQFSGRLKVTDYYPERIGFNKFYGIKTRVPHYNTKSWTPLLSIVEYQKLVGKIVSKNSINVKTIVEDEIPREIKNEPIAKRSERHELSERRSRNSITSRYSRSEKNVSVKRERTRRIEGNASRRLG